MGDVHPDLDWPAGRSMKMKMMNCALPGSLANQEIFGQSVLERTVARFKQAGLQNISVIAPSGSTSFYETKNVRLTIPKPSEDSLSIVKRILLKDLQRGIDTVLIAEIGAYVELDLAAALQFHRARSSDQAVTPIHDHLGSLSYWIVDAARVLSGTEFSFPPEEDGLINAPACYKVEGYVNRLANPRDFRKLAIDAFLGRSSLRPTGREVKPGVWVENGARVHKTARLVAPCYLGRDVRVRAGAVITRCSNIERNCEVGEGSLVSDASLLPHTMCGNGLDISTAIVDRVDFVDLARNVVVHIEDPNLISDVPPQKRVVPAYLPEYEEVERPTPALDPESSQYLSRAKGRLLEVFKGGV